MERVRRLIRSRATARGDESGTLTLFFVAMALGLFMMIGLVVDGGGKIRALQAANAAAQEAARTGGQSINGPEAILGNAPTLSGEAQSVADDYLSGLGDGISGHATVVDPTHLKVDASKTYQPVFLGLVGFGPQTVTGHAEVTLATGPGQ